MLWKVTAHDFTKWLYWKPRFIKNIQQRSNAIQKEKIAVNTLERKIFQKKSLRQERICAVAENRKEAKRYQTEWHYRAQTRIRLRCSLRRASRTRAGAPFAAGRTSRSAECHGQFLAQTFGDLLERLERRIKITRFQPGKVTPLDPDPSRKLRLREILLPADLDQLPDQRVLRL